MKRRGLTLLELLLAMVLVTGLLLASANLLRVAATIFHAALADHRWESAATGVVNRIADDVMCSDNSGTSNEPLARCENGSLYIRTRWTRDGSAPIHQVRYSYDQTTHLLQRAPVGTDEEPVAILGRVSRFRAQVEGRRLSITIESDSGQVAAREVRFP